MLFINARTLFRVCTGLFPTTGEDRKGLLIILIQIVPNYIGIDYQLQPLPTKKPMPR